MNHLKLLLAKHNCAKNASIRGFHNASWWRSPSSVAGSSLTITSCLWTLRHYLKMNIWFFSPYFYMLTGVKLYKQISFLAQEGNKTLPYKLKAPNNINVHIELPALEGEQMKFMILLKPSYAISLVWPSCISNKNQDLSLPCILPFSNISNPAHNCAAYQTSCSRSSGTEWILIDLCPLPLKFPLRPSLPQYSYQA